jgi:hypothetical protein
MTSFWGGTARKATGNIFKLGDRDKVLSDNDKVRDDFSLSLSLLITDVRAQLLIVPHEAMEKNLRFQFEVLFRSMMHLLIDTISPEHEFDLEFFAKMDLFGAIFEKTLVVYNVCFILPLLSSSLPHNTHTQEFYDAYLRDSYDAVAILLSVQIINQCKEKMAARKLAVLNAHLDKMLEMSWTRLKAVLELNIDSVRKVNPKDAPPTELRIHPVTRHYSELLLSLYLVSGKTLDSRLHPCVLIMICHNTCVTSSLHRYLAAMRSASAALVVKLSQEVSNKKMRTVFLVNTYDSIIQALRVRLLAD